MWSGERGGRRTRQGRPCLVHVIGLKKWCHRADSVSAAVMRPTLPMRQIVLAGLSLALLGVLCASPSLLGNRVSEAIDGLGNEQPTLLLSNNKDETARNLVIRYAGRNRVEDGLGSAVNFFHLDCLASEVRLNVDLDSAMTVLANGCYRWLGRQLKGYEKAHAKQLYRCFVETGGVVQTTEEQIVVSLDRRSHNPILREAALDQSACDVPWLQNRRVRFVYS